MRNQVDVLIGGYSRTDPNDESIMYANCTCTLIRTHSGRNIIVDTMTAWDGDQLVRALSEYHLQPQDIHVVVCTHGHSDHIGCNYLFRDAQWHLVGACISHHDKYIDWDWDKPFQLDGDDVIVQRTPGHTVSCVTVLVRDSQWGQLMGICGDLFERVEDINDSSIWIEAGSEDFTAQRQHRASIAGICSYIIPGHGPGFPVTKEMRDKLNLDLATK